MARENDDLLRALLGPLHMHFQAAGEAYQEYLSNDKSFLYASSLRRINASARKLLMRKGYLLPKERDADAMALIRHYDVWLTLWDDLAARTQPAMNSEFFFENPVTYPKSAESSLEQLYERSLPLPHALKLSSHSNGGGVEPPT